jgi:cellulose synthase/poly-beta-1,6-N-acetylglucosamine synthase-like glycosyltransferase
MNRFDAPRQMLCGRRWALVRTAYNAADLPTLTVIIPAFNEERTIAELLRRLVAISEGCWQIIVVNDG